jgi:hypothetical protein
MENDTIVSVFGWGYFGSLRGYLAKEKVNWLLFKGISASPNRLLLRSVSIFDIDGNSRPTLGTFRKLKGLI